MNAHQRRKAVRAWWRLYQGHAFPEPIEDREVPADVLARIPEYSTTIPTGAGPGRIWKTDIVFKTRFALRMQRTREGWNASRRRLPPRWVRKWWILATVLDEPHGEGGHVIRYQRVRVVGSPS